MQKRNQRRANRGWLWAGVIAATLFCCLIGNIATNSAGIFESEPTDVAIVATLTTTAIPERERATSTSIPPTVPPPATATTVATTAPLLPNSSTVPAPLAANYPALPTGLASATVTRVIDGDTIDVDLNGSVVRVRLIGIDTPETVHPSRPVECFGQEASAQAKALLTGQTVFLEADTSQDSVDRYGRQLRYVWLPDGRLFNLEMIAQGYAFEYTYNIPYKYYDAFTQAEQTAREEQRGLWAPEACNGEQRPADNIPAAPQPAPTASIPTPAEQPPAEQTGNCDPSYPGVCIPPFPPDLDCGEIPYRRFEVIPPDPHGFDGDNDGIGCER